MRSIQNVMKEKLKKNSTNNFYAVSMLWDKIPSHSLLPKHTHPHPHTPTHTHTQTQKQSLLQSWFNFLPLWNGNSSHGLAN